MWWMSQDSNSKKPKIGDVIRVKVASARSAAASSIRNVADLAATLIEGPRESFQGALAPVEFQFDVSGETIWATQQQMADLFGVAANTVTEHLKNIFREGELDEQAVARKFRAPGKDGKSYNTLHYNLDAVIAVGYRVNSKRATQFRQWATSKLSAYVRDGFVLNEGRLRTDADALAALTDRYRTLRANEQCFYARVRDCFKMSAIDYDPKSDAARLFYARAQNMVLYAVSERTAADLILQRADSSQKDMGLTTFAGQRPNTTDVTIGKNYLYEDELTQLKIISDQFLSFVESKAMRGKMMTMERLLEKLTDLLVLNEFPIQTKEHFGSPRQQAERHAKRELRVYQAKAAMNTLRAPLRQLRGS
jgi:hypothetical protein